MLKKIYSILKLLFNVLIRRKHYTVGFFSEKVGDSNVWYYNFKNWGFSKYYLMMVCGADILCEKYSNGQDKFNIDIIASKKQLTNPEGYDEFEPI